MPQDPSDAKEDLDWPAWAKPAGPSRNARQDAETLRCVRWVLIVGGKCRGDDGKLFCYDRTRTYGGRETTAAPLVHRSASEGGQRFRVHTTEHFQPKVVPSNVLSDGCWRCLKCNAVNEDAQGNYCSNCATVKGSSGRRAADEPVPVRR
jgi:hypothetical protein